MLPGKLAVPQGVPSEAGLPERGSSGSNPLCPPPARLGLVHRLHSARIDWLNEQTAIRGVC